jgi:hypothetical protein
MLFAKCLFKLLYEVHGVSLGSSYLRYSSGNTGSAIMFTVDGSSRSFKYNIVPFGRGTLSVESTKPAGTGTVWLNCESDAPVMTMEKFRRVILFLPLSFTKTASLIYLDE